MVSTPVFTGNNAKKEIMPANTCFPQINKIKKLTLDEFEDKPVISIEPNFKKGLIAMHHLHQLENDYVFDVCYKKL